MRQLFLNNGLTWTKEADEIVKEAKLPLQNIMQKWIELGFSPREIAHLFFWTAHDIELDNIIRAGEKLEKSGSKSITTTITNNEKQKE